jgi:transglutaminase-like putative cysteine protease
LIYSIRLVTTSDYESAVPFARHVLRCIPRDRPGLRVLESSLQIKPEPSDLSVETDFFGNDRRVVTIETQHQKMLVNVILGVERIAPPPPELAASPPWEKVRDAALLCADLGPEAPAHFLFESRIVQFDDAITAFAAACFPLGTPILVGAHTLMLGLHEAIRFDADATDVQTKPREAFAIKRGVCQDFAHIMIAGLRALGLPAAYASGFLRTLPAPGKPRLEGVDATHAWVQVWCGDALGWIEFDPTNRMLADNSHIQVAHGRDYADVAPLDGVIISYGGQRLDVAVDVAELAP